MKERSINFTADMASDMYRGRKTQISITVDRVTGFGNVREFQRSETPGYDYTFRCQRGLWQDFREGDLLKRCPFGSPGDRLYVRESWQVETGKTRGEDRVNIRYRDMCCKVWWMPLEGPKPLPQGLEFDHWRSPSTMPRWASRLVIELVKVRVERLRPLERMLLAFEDNPPESSFATDVDAFAATCEIDIRRAAKLATNPYQWVIDYKELERS